MVNDEAFAVGSEGVGAHVSVGLFSIVASAGPRAYFQQCHQFGEERQRVGWQGSDLLVDVVVGVNHVHLTTGPIVPWFLSTGFVVYRHRR